MEFIINPDEAMETYFYHRTVLFSLIMMNLFFELFLTIYIYRNKEYMVLQLNQLYRGNEYNKLLNLVETTTILNLIFNLFQYFFGFYTIASNKVTNYNCFNILMVMSIFFRCLLTYLNTMNLFMLVLKGLTLVYSKFVVSLLISVLIMPPVRNNSEVLDDENNS